jgi:hypothetical protein
MENRTDWGGLLTPVGVQETGDQVKQRLIRKPDW